jgi:hypothetical protein
MVRGMAFTVEACERDASGALMVLAPLVEKP